MIKHAAANASDGRVGVPQSDEQDGSQAEVGYSLPLPVEPRLRVCVLAACPFPANHGTPGSIREMSEAIAERGHEVHVVTYHIGEEIPVQGVTIHRIPRWTSESQVVVGPTARRPIYDALLVWQALRVIRRHRPHLIHAHGYEAALAAWICRWFTRLPIVYSAHNVMSDELAAYDVIRPRWLARSLARVLDALVPRIGNRCIPHSAGLAQFLHERGLSKRCEPVIPFGVRLRYASPRLADSVRKRYGLDGPVICYTGVLDRFQRLDLLLDALAAVTEVEPSAKLLVVVNVASQKNLADFQQQAAQRGILDHVVITEALSLDQVLVCLSAADVTVIPRPNAPGFPIKLLNYMAAAKPCVMFASSASNLEDRQHAMLVQPDTGPALAQGILEVLKDPQLQTQLGQRARQYAATHHDRRVLARQVCQVYMRTLGFSEVAVPQKRAEADAASDLNEVCLPAMELSTAV